MNLTTKYLQRLLIRPERNYKPIDGIRAIAVLWVIIFHAWLFQYLDFKTTGDKIFNYSLLIWISKGDLGVDLFFVISGFLIGTILFKEFKKNNKIQFSKFYVNRFLRLMPVYIFSMIIGIYFLDGHPAGNWKMAWSNLIYINNFIRESYMGWTWSLAIEEQFYLVAPFLIAFFIPIFKNKLIPFLFLASLTILLTYHYSFNVLQFEVPFKHEFVDDDWINWFWDYYMLTHLRYGGLLSGVIGAYLNVYYGNKISTLFKRNKGIGNALFILSLILFFTISSVSLGQWSVLKESIFDGINKNIPQFYEVIHRELFSYSVLFIILSCQYLKTSIVYPINRFLSARLFYPIAQISYSAYLFHEMFMFWFYPKFIALTIDRLQPLEIVLLNGAISLIAIIIFATLMYLCIEQPFQDLRKRVSFSSQNKQKSKIPIST